MLELRFLIRKIDLAVRRLAGEMLAEYGLTPAQAELLYQLTLSDGSDQHTLAVKIGITKASLSSLLDGLEEQKLVRRQQHPEDSRLKQVYLTEHARSLMAQMKSISHELERRMGQGFSNAELELFGDWLQRLAKNLEGS